MEAHQLAERECETGLMSGQQNVTVLVILCFFCKHWPVEQSPSLNHTSLLFTSQSSLESMTIGRRFYGRQPLIKTWHCSAVRKTGIFKENYGDVLLFAKPCKRFFQSRDSNHHGSNVYEGKEGVFLLTCAGFISSHAHLKQKKMCCSFLSRSFTLSVFNSLFAHVRLHRSELFSLSYCAVSAHFEALDGSKPAQCPNLTFNRCFCGNQKRVNHVDDEEAD